MLLPVQPSVPKRLLEEFPDRMQLAHADYVIAAVLLLEDEPHGFDVFWSIAPVPLGIKISEINLLFLAGHYPGNTDGLAVVYFGWRATDFPVFKSYLKSEIALYQSIPFLKLTRSPQPGLVGCIRRAASRSLRHPRSVPRSF